MDTSCLATMVFVAILVGYFTASAVLFFYPTLIHEKKRSKFKCRNISHRGGSAEGLENTMKTFAKAIEAGTEMLELDCQITKDGQVVVCHDDHLLRLCGHDVKISDLNYIALPSIRRSLKVQFMPGSAEVKEEEDRKIPLLEDVFLSFPDVPINLEVKVHSAELVHKVSELIKKHNREKLTVWGSATGSVSDLCYQENQNIPMYFSKPGVIRMLILLYVGLLPFVPLKESFYECFLFKTMLKHMRGAPFIEDSWKMRLGIKVLDFLTINRLIAYHLRRRGIQMYYFVLNDEEGFDRAFKMGADGVMTDCPTKLTQYLKNSHDLPTYPVADYPEY